MDKERREDLRKRNSQDSVAFGDLGQATISRRELRALLDSDEALERAQKVVEDLKADPDHEMQDIGYNIDRAIIGDGGKEEG